MLSKNPPDELHCHQIPVQGLCATGAALPAWEPVRQLIIDALEEVLFIQTGVDRLALRDGLISPISWQLRVQIIRVLVSHGLLSTAIWILCNEQR